MLKFYLLDNKLFNSVKSIFFFDYYINITLNYILSNFINSFSILILERYLLDFLFRGFLVCINLNLSNIFMYRNLDTVYLYTIYTFNILILFIFI